MARTERKRNMMRDCLGGRGPLYRYFAMFLICLLGLGAYTCTDSVGALQTVLMKVLDIKEDNFSLLYSVISWPGSVLCLVGGFLIDRVFGLKWAAIVASIFVSVGQYTFGLGVTLGIFWLALLGRFIFGFGVEIVVIALSCYCISWFKDKELSLSMCVMISVNRLGTAIMFESAPAVYNSFVDEVGPNGAAGLANFLVGISTLISAGIAVALMFLKPQEKEEGCENEEQKNTEGKFKIIDLLRLPFTFWILAFMFASYTTCIFSFVPFSQHYFSTLHGTTLEQANRITSSFSIMGAVMAPFTGIAVDKFGRTAYFLVIGMLLASISHVLLTFTTASPYVGITLLAIAFTLFSASLGPLLSYIVPESKLGTAFGVCMSLLNLVFTINVLVSGQLLTHYGYREFGIYLLAWPTVGLVVSIIFCIIDRRGTGYLNMSPAQRREFDANKKKRDEAEIPLKA